jgi:hypothetical protein
MHGMHRHMVSGPSLRSCAIGWCACMRASLKAEGVLLHPRCVGQLGGWRGGIMGLVLVCFSLTPLLPFSV